MVSPPIDARDQIAKKVENLDGATVVEAGVDHQGCALRLSFENGLILTTSAIFSKEYEHWFVYMPDGSVITAGPGLAYSAERADTP